ncbi:MAG: glutaminyl-peptide cyclotransferase [Anaerolineales bacterium]|nr:glutaminyl-peptide cyclotransferase [Anaerolineales bacterium]
MRRAIVWLGAGLIWLALAACLPAATPPPVFTSAPTLTPAPTVTPPPTATPRPCERPPAPDAGPAYCQTCQPPGGWALPAGPAPLCTYRVVQAFPHDPEAFTQGLVYLAGELYEGTGLNGRSSLRRVALESGAVQQRLDLPGDYFGEGVAVLGDRIFQLTWQNRVGFVYDRRSFTQLQTFAYSTEGWGLTHDGQRLILSDGTATLYFLDPATLAVTGQVAVADAGTPVVRLNELEYINGLVYANLWQTDRIARIDPATGQVVSWIDLTGLLPPEDRQQPVDVLNGIAYDEAADRLFLTGKLWPKLFEVKLRAGGP